MAAPPTSTGWMLPSNDVNSHVEPRRTAFSVSGSFCGSKNGWPRLMFTGCPPSSSSIVSADPLAQSMKKLRGPAAKTRLQPGVGTSETKRRATTSTIESELTGVRLKTARKRPSSESALAALPGKYSARLGGIPISWIGASVRAS